MEPEPSMYCGASSHHIHCENFNFKIGEKLLYFGRDEVDKTTTWIDVRNCTGIITQETFTLFPELDYLNFDNSTLQFSSKAFALLKKLKAVGISRGKISITKDMFEDNEALNSLNLSRTILPDSNCFAHLNKLEMLNIEDCEFENSSGDILQNLQSLKYLIIVRSKLNGLGNIYKNMENLESLHLVENKIGEFHWEGILKLKKLTHLGIFSNEISSTINYQMFQAIPSLETILLDTNAYKDMDFLSFANLKTVQIGTLTDIISEEENALMEKLKAMNIDFQYTFCGTIEVDMSKVMICA